MTGVTGCAKDYQADKFYYYYHCTEVTDAGGLYAHH